MDHPDKAESFLRLPAVIKRCGCSRSEIYRLEALGKFPNRIKIGTRSVAWVESEVQSWINERIKEHRRNGCAI